LVELKCSIDIFNEATGEHGFGHSCPCSRPLPTPRLSGRFSPGQEGLC
jgi:hypothetical protein